MKEYDFTVLTDPRYFEPEANSTYVKNVLLEDRLLQESLTALGFRVNRLPWSMRGYNWSQSKYLIFRSTWDYFDHLTEFKLFLHETSKHTIFINSKSLLEWNLDKHYLLDLHKKGIDIPPTVMIEPGTSTSLSEQIKRQGWDEVVLKPAIAAAGRHTYRFKQEDANLHEALYQRLIHSEAMLIQEFQKSVPERGEVALVYFSGEYSHAVLKRAKPGDFRVQDDFGGTIHAYEPTADELDLGFKAISVCNSTPIYARVDIIEDNRGKPVLTELELIEPELWLRNNSDAADRFASAIAHYVSSFPS